MIITWYGHSCFKINTKDVTIITDPFSKEIGIKPYFGAADIVTVSHEHYDHNNIASLKGNPFVASNPGEYEVKNVFIRGIASYHDKKQGAERGLNTIFVIDAEDLRVCHLGDLGEILSDKVVEQLGQVDILMIPVGGVYTIDAKEADELIEKIEPAIVIPMHYKTPSLAIKLDGLDKFLSVRGIKGKETLPHLAVKKKEINPEENKVVILEAAH